MRERKPVYIAILAVLAVFVLSPIPVRAITSGEPDNGQHPYVGLVVFYDERGEPQWRCSGSLLTPTVFLTAGHCTSDPVINIVRAQVWFDEHIELGDLEKREGYPFTGGIMGRPHTHPGFDNFQTFPATHDVGVVVLDEPVNGKGFAVLPPLNYLDDLDTRRGQKELVFTVVGYGLQEIRPHFTALRDRYKATSMLVNLRSALTDGYNIHTSNNPGQGTKRGENSGGTCFGDSGGPVFHGGYESNLLIGITSFGLNPICKGANFAYRADIADTQSFLASFGVPLP